MKYDINYYDGLLRNYSNTAELINKIRWDFVESCEAKTVLDFGSGVGCFRAFRPNGIHVDTYDIMPVFQTGITLNKYDLITLWDSFEHTYSCDAFIRMGKWVALTLPIFPGGDITKWKHYKPGEHVRLFKDNEDVIMYFNKLNMEPIKIRTPECPPRQDITSFLFKERD
jgi:hypothetical protein